MTLLGWFFGGGGNCDNHHYETVEKDDWIIKEDVDDPFVSCNIGNVALKRRVVRSCQHDGCDESYSDWEEAERFSSRPSAIAYIAEEYGVEVEDPEDGE